MAGLDGAITIGVPALIGIAAGMVIAAVAILMTVRSFRALRRRRAARQSAEGYQVGIATVRGPKRHRSGTQADPLPRPAPHPFDDLVEARQTPDTADRPSRWPLVTQSDAREVPYARDGESELATMSASESRAPRGAARRLFGDADRLQGLDAARALFVVLLIAPAIVPWLADVEVLGAPVSVWCSRLGLAGVLLVSASASASVLRRGAESPNEATRRRLRRLARSAMLLPIAAVLLALELPGGAEVLVVAVLAPLTVLFAPLRLRLLVPLSVVLMAVVSLTPSMASQVLPARADALPALDAAMAVTGWAATHGVSVGLALVAVVVGTIASHAALRRGGARSILAATGAAAAGLGILATAVAPPEFLPAWARDAVFSPVRSSAVVLLISVGVVCALVGLLLLVQRPLRAPLLSLSAPGSMTLSGTAIGALAVGMSASTLVPDSVPSVAVLLSVALAAAMLGVLWRLALGEGPLERLTTAILDRLAPSATQTTAQTTPQAAQPETTAQAPADEPEHGPGPPVPRQASHWIPGQALGRLPY